MTHIDTRSEACERMAARMETGANMTGATSQAAALIRQLVRERDEAREALQDISSWFDGGPSIYGPWIIKSGDNGADDAVEFARAALKGPKP